MQLRGPHFYFWAGLAAVRSCRKGNHRLAVFSTPDQKDVKFSICIGSAFLLDDQDEDEDDHDHDVMSGIWIWVWICHNSKNNVNVNARIKKV
ncbi:hypothetical protein B5S32_g2187 [[Candida] boidinii]|nr:hypothetical protein B5S32_g2187 [[Candida] boidinii]